MFKTKENRWGNRLQCCLGHLHATWEGPGPVPRHEDPAFCSRTCEAQDASSGSWASVTYAGESQQHSQLLNSAWTSSGYCRHLRSRWKILSLFLSLLSIFSFQITKPFLQLKRNFCINITKGIYYQ